MISATNRSQYIDSKKLEKILYQNKEDIKKISKYFSKRYRLPYADVNQSVRIAIWKYFNRFKEGKGRSFKSFIFTSTFWQLSKEYDISKKANTFQENEKFELLPDSRVNINTTDFYDCLNRIPDLSQKILKMYYIENRKLHEISSILNKSLETVLKYKNKGLLQFRKEWENVGTRN